MKRKTKKMMAKTRNEKKKHLEYLVFRNVGDNFEAGNSVPKSKVENKKN